MATLSAKMSLFLSCLMTFSSLVGCAERKIANVSLLYDTKLQPPGGLLNGSKIYLTKPTLGPDELYFNNRLINKNTSVVGNFNFTHNGHNEPSSVHIGIASYNQIPVASTPGPEPLNITAITEDSPADWVAGALGTELKALGYQVEYVNIPPKDDNLAISLVVNKCKADTYKEFVDDKVLFVSRITLKSSISIGFTISRKGEQLYVFDVLDEKELDEPEYARCWFRHDLNFYKNRLAACHSNILKSTLETALGQATKTIHDFAQEGAL